MGDGRVAVVTGGNRGLGREVCRGLAERGDRVLLCSRDRSKGEQVAAELRKAGGWVEARELDVTNADQIRCLGEAVEQEFGCVDVLVNCAGIAGGPYGQSFLDVSDEALQTVLATNFFGPLHLCQAFVPLMRRRGYGRVVNVSSGMGQLSDMGGGSPAYRLSKTSLNVLTRVLARELEGTDVLVNSVCPGWVRTDMGGERATPSVEEGARGILWAATLPTGGPSGGFFRHGEPIPW